MKVNGSRVIGFWAIGFLAAMLAITQGQAQETDYATVKGWRIFSGPGSIAGGDMCYASKDNGKVELRLATEGNGEWMMGMPYSQDGEVQGQFGFTDSEGYLETVRFAASNGWAYTVLPAPEALRNSDVVTMSLDHGAQEFDLSGSAAAMTKAEECAINGGHPPRKLEQAAEVDNQVENEAYRLGQGCPKLGAVVSEDTGKKAKVEFRYKIASDRATIIYWLDFRGKPVEMSTFDSATNVVEFNSFVGHSFIVKDFDGTCYGDFYEVQPGKNVFVVH